MIKRFIRNIFPKSRRIELRVGDFNHCSSLCAHKDGLLVTWYAGSGECRDDQSAYVMFVNHSHQSIPLRIGDKTGNPVLIPFSEERAALLWSVFEDTGNVRNIVDRWKYCSLHVVMVTYHGGRIQLLGTPNQIAESHQHLLGRCNPIKYDIEYLLPLYDEVARQGVIFKGSGTHFEEIGRLGKDMIQPTLWVADDKLHSLSRNFMNRTNFKARYCYSADGGKTWSDPAPTFIPNRNSSLHACCWNGQHMLLWNNTPLTQRKDMTLGIIDGTNVKIVKVLGDYGAYPSMCVDFSGDLNMSYTSMERTIILHTWNHKYFKKQVFEKTQRR